MLFRICGTSIILPPRRHGPLCIALRSLLHNLRRHLRRPRQQVTLTLHLILHRPLNRHFPLLPPTRKALPLRHRQLVVDPQLQDRNRSRTAASRIESAYMHVCASACSFHPQTHLQSQKQRKNLEKGVFPLTSHTSDKNTSTRASRLACLGHRTCSCSPRP